MHKCHHFVKHMSSEIVELNMVVIVAIRLKDNPDISVSGNQVKKTYSFFTV